MKNILLRWFDYFDIELKYYVEKHSKVFVAARDKVRSNDHQTLSAPLL
jgi:hypothetical protein